MHRKSWVSQESKLHRNFRNSIPVLNFNRDYVGNQFYSPAFPVRDSVHYLNLIKENILIILFEFLLDLCSFLNLYMNDHLVLSRLLNFSVYFTKYRKVKFSEILDRSVWPVVKWNDLLPSRSVTHCKIKKDFFQILINFRSFLGGHISGLRSKSISH